MREEYDFDVALSFAGEQRQYVKQVAEYLKTNDIDVFYDFFHQSELWGKDLTSALEDVYSYKSRYCVIFISKEYLAKEWTCYESAAAMQRLLKSRVKRQEYILPVKFDDTKVPGVFDTIGYLDGNHFKPEEIGEMLIQKINKIPNTIKYQSTDVFETICNKITSDLPCNTNTFISRSKNLAEIGFTCNGRTRLYIKMELEKAYQTDKLLVYSCIGEPVYLMEVPSAWIIMHKDIDSNTILSADYSASGFSNPIFKQNTTIKDVVNTLITSIKQYLEGIY